MEKERGIKITNINNQKQCDIHGVISSPFGTKFNKGEKVCSYGDVTTFGYISHWDEIDRVWVLTTDEKGSYKWWTEDEPVLFEDCL